LLRLGYEVSRLGTGLLIFALQVRQGDSEIAHGHVRGAMTEEFHDAGKADARAEHECGVGVSKLMRDDARGDSRCSRDVVQCFTESSKQHFPSARPGQKKAIGRRRVERAPEAEALNELANERIHRNHAFGFHLAERDVNCPFPRNASTQANRKIDRRTRRCAYRCGGVTRVHCWPDRCAGPVPAEGVDRVRRLAGAVSFFRVAGNRHDGADAPGRASARSRP
jgi:hypothetical protein